MRSCAAALRHWAVIAISAPSADIRPSPTTPAVTGTAPSVRPVRAISGCGSDSRSCCPSATTTWPSACHIRLCRCCGRTNGSSSPCCSKPVPPRCSTSLPIRSISTHSLASCPSCTPGDRRSRHFRTSTAWCLVADSRRTTHAGSLPGPASCYRSRCSAASSAASSSPDCAAFCPPSVALLRRVHAAP